MFIPTSKAITLSGAPATGYVKSMGYPSSYRDRTREKMQIKKLPDLAALRKEYRSLNDRKTKLYEDYRQAKKQMQEYGVVKKNVDSILYPSQSRAREQER